jgi:hypothetical protein
VSTPQRPELHLNARLVLLLEVSKQQGKWVASERVCTTEACAAPGGVYTTEAWAASEHEVCAAPGGVYTTGAWAACKNGSALQRPVLLLEVSTPQGPELHLNVRFVLLLDVSHSHHRVLSCRTCSLRFENNFLIIECVRFVLKIIFFLTNVKKFA